MPVHTLVCTTVELTRLEVIAWNAPSVHGDPPPTLHA
jgi:hypothetical protein